MAVIISLYHSIFYGHNHVIGAGWILYTIAVTIVFFFISWGSSDGLTTAWEK